MSRFTLAFGIHNHQPVGNFDHVFEEAHRHAYLPFVKLLERFPGIRLSLHQSGILWDWQQQKHHAYFDQISRLLGRNQIELMTGGFYEPILPAIPERDVLGQIAMLNAYLESHFGVNPKGLWLTERVWEPHLPKLLAKAGVTHLPVDDTHFIFAGLEHEQLCGPFVTESEGYAVTALPIEKKLRYLIPFGRVEEVIDELKRQAERSPDGMAVYADDGEKFGVWPKTYQHCYEDRWLEQFFEALERNGDWLEMITLSEAAERPAVGRVYLPTASYEEMLHWALPAKAFVEYEQFEEWLKDQGKLAQYARFVRGGHWRSFLAKYEEANLMHKRMVRVSNMLAEFERECPSGQAGLSEVRDRLYASQCNCPYWHGVFGGLYLPHIRQAVYEAMIAAEDQLGRMTSRLRTGITVSDYDADGAEEVLCTTARFSAVIKPSRGGILADLALLKQHFDLTDTLSRRREGYHRKLARAVTAETSQHTSSIHDLVLAKESGLDQLLIEDRYLRRCFIDHFFAADVTADQFYRMTFQEVGDFVTGRYDYLPADGKLVVDLIRNGTVRHNGTATQIRVSKRFGFDYDSGQIVVGYELSAPNSGPIEVLFAIENNFSFQAGHAHDRYIIVDGARPSDSFLDTFQTCPQGQGLAMADEYRNLAVAILSDRQAELWHMPIFTVSLSEAGFEKVYQGTTLVHLYRLHLTTQPVKLTLRLLAGPLQSVLAQAFPRSAVSAI
ncbi:MAG: alpha-amylase/4-alpha-glucanotransferase domain-containing protein [Candidatus Zixiibacteriota bacterium]